jgi:predicted metal-dependent peptidase
MFSRDLPTAGVYFDKEGDTIAFRVNPEFWATLTTTQKRFIICHEICHVLFLHGKRIKDMDKANMTLANKAADIVVNHFIVNSLGFERSKVDPDNKYCWTNTVFAHMAPAIIPDNRSFEYYYDLLIKNPPPKNDKGEGQGDLVDSHDGLGDFSSEEFNRMMEGAVRKDELKDLLNNPKIRAALGKEVPNENKQDATSTKEKGTGEGGNWMQAILSKRFPKRKWESVIKNWAMKYIRSKDKEQWLKTARKYNALPKGDMFLPSTEEVENLEKSRIRVWAFQDTSGSCQHLAQRFFGALRTLPEDKFDVKAHCFDTKVYPTDLKTGKLYGFGGTSFSCIEEYIQSELKKTNSTLYPQAVFVITDGYGDAVSPEKSNRWFWFLSEPYEEYVPKDSKKYMLEDFE